MELADLYALKAGYEKELILAEAKVKVITDLIVIAEEKNRPVEETPVEESESAYGQQTSIY